MPLRALFVLALLCARALADTATPSDARAIPVHALRGPFASLEAYCAGRRRHDDWMRACVVARRLPHTAAIITHAGGGQREVLLAVENGGGWYVDERDVLFDGNRDRGGFVIVGLGDGGGGARLRGVQAHWHKPLTDDYDGYYCFAVEVHCYLRGGEPLCTDPLPVAGRRDCGLANEADARGFDATRWDWQQEIRDAGDGSRLEIRRLTWRAFPTRFSGYSDWMRETAVLARSLEVHAGVPEQSPVDGHERVPRARITGGEEDR